MSQTITLIVILIALGAALAWIARLTYWAWFRPERFNTWQLNRSQFDPISRWLTEKAIKSDLDLFFSRLVLLLGLAFLAALWIWLVYLTIFNALRP